MRHALALSGAAAAAVIVGLITSVAVHPLVGVGIGLGLFAALATGAGVSGGRRP